MGKLSQLARDIDVPRSIQLDGAGKEHRVARIALGVSHKGGPHNGAAGRIQLGHVGCRAVLPFGPQTVE